MNEIDKDLIARRFARSLNTYEEEAIVQREMANKLLDLVKLSSANQRYERIFEIGCGSGILSREVVAMFDYERFILNDLVSQCKELAKELPNAEFIAGDIESIQLPDSIDLVLSNATLQWLKNPRIILSKLAKYMNKNGVIAISVFGPDNCREISTIDETVKLAYFSSKEWQKIFEEHFEVIAMHEELISLEFETPMEALHHLKLTGVTATGGGKIWTRSKLNHFCSSYQQEFSLKDGGVTLTYHPIIIIGKLS